MGRGHTCTPTWEVPNGHLAVHTGRRTPKHDGSDDSTVGVGSHVRERNEKGQRTEAIERPRGDGVLRRAAGDAAARSAHPGPDHRPLPPCSRRRCMGRGHTCTPTWEVPNGHLAVHTGRRTPKHDGSDDSTVGVGSHVRERNEKGQRTEAIERPRGDGVLRRAAGDAAARSAHPGPDYRPLPPSASGVPARSCAQAVGGGRGLNE